MPTKNNNASTAGAEKSETICAPKKLPPWLKTTLTILAWSVSFCISVACWNASLAYPANQWVGPVLRMPFKLWALYAFVKIFLNFLYFLRG